jgi:hypothetical protein
MTAITAVSALLRPARLLPLLIAAALALIASLLVGAHTVFATERTGSAQAHAKYRPAHPADEEHGPSASRISVRVRERSQEEGRKSDQADSGRPRHHSGAVRVAERQSRDSDASEAPKSAQSFARHSTVARPIQKPAALKGESGGTEEAAPVATRHLHNASAVLVGGHPSQNRVVTTRAVAAAPPVKAATAAGHTLAVQPLAAVQPVAAARPVAAVRPVIVARTAAVVQTATHVRPATAVRAVPAVPPSVAAPDSAAVPAPPAASPVDTNLPPTAAAPPPQTYVLPAVPAAQSTPTSPSHHGPVLFGDPLAGRLESGLTVIALVFLVPLTAVVLFLQMRLLRRMRSLQAAAAQAQPLKRYYSMTLQDVRQLAPDMLPALAHHRFCESNRHQGRWRAASWLELEEIDSETPLMWATCETCHHQRMTTLTSSGEVAASP